MWGRYVHEGVRQSVSAEIIRALGKGCLAATACVLLGMIAGTLHLPAASHFIIAGSAALGVVCLTGSAARAVGEGEVASARVEAPGEPGGIDGAELEQIHPLEGIR
jgi:hypothetical protein